MTAAENTALDEILRECDRVLELEAKATPGPWDNEGSTYVFAKIPGGRPNGEGIATFRDYARQRLSESQNKFNAEFVSCSRTLTPKLARALGVAIPALRKTENHLRSYMPHPRSFMERAYEETTTALRAIIDLWTK